MKITLNIGDWSGDGHSHNEEIDFEVNYTKEQLIQAYKNSCKLTGVQFNHGENYTNNLVPKHSYRHDWQIATEYEDSTIKEEAVQALKLHGIDLIKDWCEGEKPEEDLYIEDSEELADLIMKFIALSMPKDFKYSFVPKNKKNYLNGYWGDLNVQFGYGLFE